MGSRGASSGKKGGGGAESGGRSTEAAKAAENKPTEIKPVASSARIEDTITQMVQAEPDRVFYRIPTLRAAMRERGMSDAEFNRQIDSLWVKDVIQLHSGDVTSMTTQEAKDRYIDSNGFTFGTFTLSPNWRNHRWK